MRVLFFISHGKKKTRKLFEKLQEKKQSPHLAASDSPSPREEHSASISSMNTIDGALSLAIVKSWLTSFSDSPSHFETRSEDEIEKKVEAASVATAFAK